MPDEPISEFSRREDGSQPPLVLPTQKPPQRSGQPAGPATRQPPASPSAFRKPAPASDTAREIKATAPSSPSPDETLMAALQAKLSQKYGIRPDDPIFALIEILKAHEGEMRKLGTRNEAIHKEVATTILKALSDYRTAVVDGGSVTEAMQELNATLTESNVSIGMMSEHIATVQKIAEHVTQTGHMDRLLRLLAPGIAAIIALILGLVGGFVLSRL